MTNSSNDLVLVVKLAEESFVLSFELLSIENNNSEDQLNNANVLLTKHVYWPKYIHEKPVQVGFLRNYTTSGRKDTNFEDAAAIDDFLRLINLQPTSSDNSIMHSFCPKSKERGSLRLLLVTDGGQYKIYNPFAFLEKEERSSGNILEDLLCSFDDNRKFEMDKISDYEAIYSGELSIAF